MANALRHKGFVLYDEMAELVDGTIASGAGTFRAGKTKDKITPPSADSAQNTAASASTSYEPVIDPDLLAISLEEGKISDVEIDGNVPLVIQILVYVYTTNDYPAGQYKCYCQCSQKVLSRTRDGIIGQYCK